MFFPVMVYVYQTVGSLETAALSRLSWFGRRARQFAPRRPAGMPVAGRVVLSHPSGGCMKFPPFF